MAPEEIQGPFFITDFKGFGDFAIICLSNIFNIRPKNKETKEKTLLETEVLK